MSVTGATDVSTLLLGSPGGPCGCVGQPRWTHRFEMIV